jgi:hypothetical protein
VREDGELTRSLGLLSYGSNKDQWTAHLFAQNQVQDRVGYLHWATQDRRWVRLRTDGTPVVRASFKSICRWTRHEDSKAHRRDMQGYGQQQVIA